MLQDSDVSTGPGRVAARGGIERRYDPVVPISSLGSKRGTNRHWAGSGRISIESPAVEEYLQITGAGELDLSTFEVVDPFPKTDRERIRKLLNEPLDQDDDAG